MNENTARKRHGLFFKTGKGSVRGGDKAEPQAAHILCVGIKGGGTEIPKT